MRNLGVSLLFLIVMISNAYAASSHDSTETKTPPNILFLILDDVGIDQFALFGYGGKSPVATPNIDAIASQGVMFRNTWTMPECSPSRATFFEGRYPFRTSVYDAITSSDLANSQVSPYEYTVPKVLRTKGYQSALIGKAHLSGSDVNSANFPLGYDTYHQLGWDYFNGYLDGGPFPIDETAGINGGAAVYPCGFIPDLGDDPSNGADFGACYLADGSCSDLLLSVGDRIPPGRVCLENGGVFDPSVSCQSTLPGYINFGENAYYTAKWVVNDGDNAPVVIDTTHPEARGFRTTLETDKAIAWINQQEGPWMLTLGYAAAHMPLQQPPLSLLSSDAPALNNADCAQTQTIQALMKQQISAIDTEMQRLFLETELASQGADGKLVFHLQERNTYIIVIGDNGSYLATVNAPFNPLRAKAYPYQTGVWVPLIIAGPDIDAPDRSVDAMINSTDLFTLFAEIAGIDLSAVIPPSHPVDGKPVLPYLSDATQTAIRAENFTQTGTNTRIQNSPAATCIITAANTCFTLFPQQSVCENEGGIWYGAGSTYNGGEGFATCCDLNAYLSENDQPQSIIYPAFQSALTMRDIDVMYKLVELEEEQCDGNASLASTYEFYIINTEAPTPLLDNSPRQIMESEMSPEETIIYGIMQNRMASLENNATICVGDGNLDQVVDEVDLSNWAYFSSLNNGQSSWYDFNYDGLTDSLDQIIINAHLGPCPQ
jgi:hypothetical protein